MRTREWLIGKRKEKGLTQKELALKLDVSAYTIENIEQGKRRGSVNTWNKIEDYFLKNGGELKMKKCEDIKNYLERKEIKITEEETDDFSLGNYLKQSKEETIDLEDGYLFYIINKEEIKCYISLAKRTDPNDINDEYLDDSYFDGYFSVNTLDNLLKLLK